VPLLGWLVLGVYRPDILGLAGGLATGAALFDGVVPAGPWSAEYDPTGVVDLQRSDAADVEITGDTFEGRPADADRGRTFGVQVDTVRLLASL
jgi:hypothetical protein